MLGKIASDNNGLVRKVFKKMQALISIIYTSNKYRVTTQSDKKSQQKLKRVDSKENIVLYF